MVSGRNEANATHPQSNDQARLARALSPSLNPVDADATDVDDDCISRVIRDPSFDCGLPRVQHHYYYYSPTHSHPFPTYAYLRTPLRLARKGSSIIRDRRHIRKTAQFFFFFSSCPYRGRGPEPSQPPNSSVWGKAQAQAVLVCEKQNPRTPPTQPSTLTFATSHSILLIEHRSSVPEFTGSPAPFLGLRPYPTTAYYE